MCNKIAVTFEQRDDGGLRVYSDELPGFILSSSDTEAVLKDVGPVLKIFLDQMGWGKDAR